MSIYGFGRNVTPYFTSWQLGVDIRRTPTFRAILLVFRLTGEGAAGGAE